MQNQDRECSADPEKVKSLPWTIGCGPWCKKYFWEGQVRNVDSNEVDPEAPFYSRLKVKYNRILGPAIPAVFYHIFWWALMLRYNLFWIFKEKYFMSLTMIIGGTVAGMTSVGGGAVAFPAMTLAFHVEPSVARDFSMMIQATGMTGATFAIFFMGVTVDWYVLIICFISGVPVMLLGFYFVGPNMPAEYKKMAFVSIWFSYALALFILNRIKKRRTFYTIPEFKLWKAAVLVVTGIFGGIFTSFAGTGMDICCFSIMTVLFQVSEKTATPTSVVLMAVSSWVGVYWQQFMMEGIRRETWEFLAVTGFIVVVMAPFGSLLGTHFHRQTLAGCIYIINTASLIGAFCIVPLSTPLVLMSLAIIAGSFIFFIALTKIGTKLAADIFKNMDSKGDEVGINVTNEVNNVSGLKMERGHANPAFHTDYI